jgi:hypothetical protein
MYYTVNLCLLGTAKNFFFLIVRTRDRSRVTNIFRFRIYFLLQVSEYLS